MIQQTSIHSVLHETVADVPKEHLPRQTTAQATKQANLTKSKVIEIRVCSLTMDSNEKSRKTQGKYLNTCKINNTGMLHFIYFFMLHFRVSYTFSLGVEKAVQQPWRVFLTLPILEIIKQDNRSGTMCQRPRQGQEEQRTSEYLSRLT